MYVFKCLLQSNFFLKTFVKPKVVFYFVLYLKIQITLLHKTFIAFIPITKLPGILVSKEFQILFAKGITSMPCRKSYFVVGPSALNCPMYLLGPRDFPGCSFWNNWFRADDTLSGNSNSWISPLINKTIFSSSPPACFLSLVVHFVPVFFCSCFWSIEFVHDIITVSCDCSANKAIVRNKLKQLLGEDNICSVLVMYN